MHRSSSVPSLVRECSVELEVLPDVEARDARMKRSADSASVVGVVGSSTSLKAKKIRVDSPRQASPGVTPVTSAAACIREKRPQGRPRKGEESARDLVALRVLQKASREAKSEIVAEYVDSVMKLVKPRCFATDVEKTLALRVVQACAGVANVATTSTNLKGTSVKALKEFAAIVMAATEELAGRLASSRPREVVPQTLRNEVEALRLENARLKGELRQSRLSEQKKLEELRQARFLSEIDGVFRRSQSDAKQRV